jgi:hypothetical protein
VVFFNSFFLYLKFHQMNWILGISISKVSWTCFVAGGLQFGEVENLEVIFTRAKSKVCRKKLLWVCVIWTFFC